MWQQWISGVLGLGIITFPFVTSLGTGFTWTLVITGTAIAILGFLGAIEHKQMEERSHRTA